MELEINRIMQCMKTEITMVNQCYDALNVADLCMFSLPNAIH